MSTITRLPRRSSALKPARSAETGDQKIVIRGVGWDVYDCLSEAIGEDQHVRLTYDGEDLEIMTVGYRTLIYQNPRWTALVFMQNFAFPRSGGSTANPW